MNKLTFDKYTADDFGNYKQLVKDDEVMKYISGSGLSEDEAKLKFDSILAVNSQDSMLGTYKILNAEDVFIGDCKIVRYFSDNVSLEIGYILKKDFWRLGYGTLICKKLLDTANQFYPMLDIIGIIDPDNIASKRLLQKFGFESYFIGFEDNLPTEKLMLKKGKNALDCK